MSEALETDSRLSPAEVKQELEKMSPADWVRVERLAKWAFSGVAAVSHEDLLQEVCAKLLSGERVWHRGYAAVPAIASVLDSMASNYRKRETNGPIDTGTVVEAADVMEETDLLVHHVEPVHTITPEDATSDAQQVTRLEALLADDEEATLVAWEWAEGRRGKEAAEALGMNENQYEAARKRLLRKLETMEDERRNG
ncbi:sigma-70 family RNA polymerase sigma factor [Burkholderia pseudomallei]|uniref:sigma-70 family RNA polymerase sigma factor n=1 Tax=Burkholderia pseudomallei TaxID=28450 RepID=UPI001AAE3F39|nr:sigma-70 family RNA polymerase sigma factor [Burkholderia pseudomallei]MBO3034772.1 sigma-70 family RNA polymerase sigma factor [Burkholderia pseudomallei]MBO7845578.1 sigma-70 family RNA polymerase sigma factor [Burkholderia pseudomallei]